MNCKHKDTKKEQNAGNICKQDSSYMLKVLQNHLFHSYLASMSIVSYTFFLIGENDSVLE